MFCLVSFAFTGINLINYIESDKLYLFMQIIDNWNKSPISDLEVVGIEEECPVKNNKHI